MYSSYSLQTCKDLKNTFRIWTSDFEDVSFIPKVKKYNLHDCHLHELGTRYIKGYKTEVRIPSSIVENTFMREKHYKQKLYSCCKLQRCTKLLRDFAISWKSVHVFKTFMRSKIRRKHIHESRWLRYYCHFSTGVLKQKIFTPDHFPPPGYQKGQLARFWSRSF